MRVFFLVLFLFINIAVNCDAFDHQKWWENWYAMGGHSGSGSRGVLAQFKADVLNDFIAEKKIKSTIEFGSGDGYNLKMIKYDNYIGLDISPTAVKMCRDMFKNDLSKQFAIYNPESFKRSSFGDFELVVCLDVLYHVVDEEAYKKTLDDVFSFSAPYVILYTTLVDDGIPHNSPEIRHRNVLNYLKKYSNYDISIKKQKYPELSRAEFIFLTKKTSSTTATNSRKKT